MIDFVHMKDGKLRVDCGKEINVDLKDSDTLNSTEKLIQNKIKQSKIIQKNLTEYKSTRVKECEKQ